MNRTWLIVTCMALLASPLALAHSPAGTPKTYCEDFFSGERSVHDYMDPPQADTLLGQLSHGGDPKVIRQYVDGSTGDCNFDGTSGDYDGHHEWSPTLWALLSVNDGDGLLQGSVACWHERAHHPTFGPIYVVDNVFGAGAFFTVMADTQALIPLDPCGDFQHDQSTDCVGACTVTFPGGLDGAYHVLVSGGLAGHVVS